MVIKNTLSFVHQTKKQTLLSKIMTQELSLLHYFLEHWQNLGFMEINLFLANVPILYPVKTPENQSFSGVF